MVQQNQRLRLGDATGFVASKGTYSQVRRDQSLTGDIRGSKRTITIRLCSLTSYGYPRKNFDPDDPAKQRSYEALIRLIRENKGVMCYRYRSRVKSVS